MRNLSGRLDRLERRQAPPAELLVVYPPNDEDSGPPWVDVGGRVWSDEELRQDTRRIVLKVVYSSPLRPENT